MPLGPPVLNPPGPMGFCSALGPFGVSLGRSGDRSRIFDPAGPPALLLLVFEGPDGLRNGDVERDVFDGPAGTFFDEDCAENVPEGAEELGGGDAIDIPLIFSLSLFLSHRGGATLSLSRKEGGRERILFTS